MNIWDIFKGLAQLDPRMGSNAMPFQKYLADQQLPVAANRYGIALVNAIDLTKTKDPAVRQAKIEKLGQMDPSMKELTLAVITAAEETAVILLTMDEKQRTAFLNHFGDDDSNKRGDDQRTTDTKILLGYKMSDPVIIARANEQKAQKQAQAVVLPLAFSNQDSSIKINANSIAVPALDGQPAVTLTTAPDGSFLKTDRGTIQISDKWVAQLTGVNKDFTNISPQHLFDIGNSLKVTARALNLLPPQTYIA